MRNKTQTCPGSGAKAERQNGPWRGICPNCGKQVQVKIDGTFRRHGVTRAQMEAWRQQQRDETGARIVCPWCPHILDDHDEDGCDHVIEVGGYEYICNCGQTPNEITDYLHEAMAVI